MNADPVLARRARIASWVKLGKRTGYASLLLAVVAFFVGVALAFPSWTVDLAIAGLIGACVALPPAVVFGYAVRAAERDERGERAGH